MCIKLGTSLNRNYKKSYGIWGERFQVIHRGHEHMLPQIANRYTDVCIAIVNPNPENPACNARDHAAFARKRNPFTYFQRAYLWHGLLQHYNINAVIVPHWHPRKSLKLESTFLPKPAQLRKWVIPFYEDEKIEDFLNEGEKIETFGGTYSEIQWLRYAIPLKIDQNSDNKSLKAYIPEKHQQLRKRFLSGGELKEKFIIIPIVEDKIEPLLICGGMQQSANTGATLVFSPVVKVQDKEDWWKCEPIEDSVFTFYQKYEIINSVMWGVDFYDYMVSPIIVRNDNCEAIDVFLPDIHCRSWLFLDDINWSPAFEQVRFEKHAEINFEEIPSDMFIEVFNILYEQYMVRSYDFHRRILQIKNMEGKSMPKYDFSNMSVENFVNVEKNEGNITVGASKMVTGESVLIDLIMANDKDEFQSLLRKADKYFENKDKTEIQRIVNDTLNKYINSIEKKETFIDKIKRFSINLSNGIIAGLLLQAVEKLVFAG